MRADGAGKLLQFGGAEGAAWLIGVGCHEVKWQLEQRLLVAAHVGQDGREFIPADAEHAVAHHARA